MAIANSTSVDVSLWTGVVPKTREWEWRELIEQAGARGLHCGPEWLRALGAGLRHPTYLIEAHQGGRAVGVLPLALVKSMLFGRFLVSLPYVNWAGVIAQDEAVAGALIDRAVHLADELDVRYLELRHEQQQEHPLLTCCLTSKVQMRLGLSTSEEAVWQGLRSVVRTQVRKGEKQGLTVHWGGRELLEDFYRVFAGNMRDLGTPVFGSRLFRCILAELPDQAELCVLRNAGRPVAGALAVHGPGLTEVPSASVLRAYRSTAANSLMYWRLIQRAIARGQRVFDFGRSTVGSSTYEFKAKWGALAAPAVWQYYLRKGTAKDMRPDSGKYDRLIAIWKRLPLAVANLLGPTIVRGIP